MSALKRAELVSMARRFSTYPDLPPEATDALVIELAARMFLGRRSTDVEQFIGEAMPHADQDRRRFVFGKAMRLMHILSS